MIAEANIARIRNAFPCLLLGLSSSVLAATSITPEIVARGLEHPWAVASIDGGRMLVTERPGRIRVIQADGKLGPPLKGVPEVVAEGQGGMLDIITDSEFARNRRIYFCYSEAGEGGNSTALASARLSNDMQRLEQVKVLFSQKPKVHSEAHFGCRIVEHGDGTLFLALGERYARMEDAQKLDNHHGKVVRIRKDGSVPSDNPYAGKNRRDGALPEIWSYGHRNPQGAALGPDGKVWINEHGPQGGDEINRPEAGKNYGWPVISHGVHYGGREVGEGRKMQPGMEAPLHHWTPSIAPSGMTFLRSDKYGSDWQGDLFVGALKFRYLVRLDMSNGKVLREEKLLEDLKQRIRDVHEGSDGFLYVLTDEQDGQLLRLLPKPQ